MEGCILSLKLGAGTISRKDAQECEGRKAVSTRINDLLNIER